MSLTTSYTTSQGQPSGTRDTEAINISDKYILEGKIPVPCDDLETWARWIEEAKNTNARRVAETTVAERYWVSTVFMGLDHDFSGRGPPILFETMILDEKENTWCDYMDRYSTWELALEGHVRAVNEATKWIN